MKPLLIVPCLLAFHVLAQAQELKISYDKFEDRTNVSTRPVNVKRGSLSLLGYFNHRGKTLTDPVSHIGLVFDSLSDNWKYLNTSDRILYILADDKRFQYDGARKGEVDRSRRPYSRVRVTERLIFSIPRDDLSAILKAKTVEIKLGRQTFTLGNEATSHLRTLVQRAIR